MKSYKESEVTNGSVKHATTEEHNVIIAELLLRFMEDFINSTRNVDPASGYSELLASLHRARMLDKGIVEACQICPICGSNMKYIGRFSVQLFSTAIFMLVKQRMFKPKSITLPSLEMVTRELENGYAVTREMKCEECGIEIVSSPKEYIELSPRLTH